MDGLQDGPAVSSEPEARPRRSARRRVLGVVLPIAITYLIIVGTMMAFEDSLIFSPSPYPNGKWTPDEFEYEDTWFTADDGVKLHGWYVAHPQPRAFVLFAHGNGGNISHRSEIINLLHKLRVTLLIFDYRGYGKSEGKPTEKGVLADARAARNVLVERSGLSETELVLMGESLGGGVMVDLAAKDGARGLILENTFSSMPDVAAHHYPWLPVRLLMRTQLNSVKNIREYHGPVLQFHGDADSIVPLAMAERLFDAANEPKKFVLIHNGDHNDPRTPEFAKALNEFFDSLPTFK